jgi:hypothetical protein
MKFELRATGYFYPDKEDRIKLEKLGFSFSFCPEEQDEQFQWEIKDNGVYIELNTLEELLAFQKLCENRLVLNNNVIQIYDDYME